MSIDDEWNDFLENCSEDYVGVPVKTENKVKHLQDEPVIPSELYISTKTEILYLSKPVDLSDVFLENTFNKL